MHKTPQLYRLSPLLLLLTGSAAGTEQFSVTQAVHGHAPVIKDYNLQLIYHNLTMEGANKKVNKAVVIDPEKTLLPLDKRPADFMAQLMVTAENLNDADHDTGLSYKLQDKKSRYEWRCKDTINSEELERVLTQEEQKRSFRQNGLAGKKCTVNVEVTALVSSSTGIPRERIYRYDQTYPVTIARPPRASISTDTQQLPAADVQVRLEAVDPQQKPRIGDVYPMRVTVIHKKTGEPVAGHKVNIYATNNAKFGNYEPQSQEVDVVPLPQNRKIGNKSGISWIRKKERFITATTDTKGQVIVNFTNQYDCPTMFNAVSSNANTVAKSEYTWSMSDSQHKEVQFGSYCLYTSISTINGAAPPTREIRAMIVDRAGRSVANKEITFIAADGYDEQQRILRRSDTTDEDGDYIAKFWVEKHVAEDRNSIFVESLSEDLQGEIIERGVSIDWHRPYP